MVRRFEMKNTSALPVRLTSQHFAKGGLFRSFGGYFAHQESTCSGDNRYYRHRSLISERLLLVPSDYTDALLEQLDETVNETTFETEIGPGKKKSTFLFAIVQPLYRLENLGTCWQGQAQIVRGCHQECVLKHPLIDLCLKWQTVQDAPTTVTLSKNIDGHGVEIENLFRGSVLTYADIDSKLDQVGIPAAPSNQKVTINGSIAFDAPVGAAFAECKL